MTDWLTREQVESFRPRNRFDGMLYDPSKAPNVEQQEALCRMALAALDAREREAKPCGECEGTGTIYANAKDSKQCPACNGTGRKV